jgi:very-short-patch-repair endonuclease
MDFLMLFSNTKRVVIEIDGKQHYSEGDISSPKLYSEMVRLDRELRFLNYDVYRLGGYELTYEMESTTLSFFDSLLEKYL